MLDLLARNAFLSHPTPYYYVGGVLDSSKARTDLTATDLFNPDITETIRVHLEENDIPGVASSEDSDASIVCTTSPRVLKDIRTAAGSKWLEVQEYNGATRKFSGEVGSWGGTRFVKSNRLRLRNMGAVTTQTTLNGATVVGQGAAATVDTVYTVGQSSATKYIVCTAVASFAVGQYITISDQNAHVGGTPPVETDGTIETRRIVSIDAGNKRLALDKPLLKPHASGDFVTNGIDLHASIFHGGPSVVYGIGEAPNVIMPPKYDDLMMVNRIGWRGFLKFQMFRPEYTNVIFSAGSTD